MDRKKFEFVDKQDGNLPKISARLKNRPFLEPKQTKVEGLRVSRRLANRPFLKPTETNEGSITETDTPNFIGRG